MLDAVAVEPHEHGKIEGLAHRGLMAFKMTRSFERNSLSSPRVSSMMRSHCPGITPHGRIAARP